MGQWYDIGLQAGKTVAEKVDEFIKNEKNFAPKRRKELRDGSVVYQWYMKWNPYLFTDEKKFCELLEEFDDDGDWLDDDEQYKDKAYKFVGVGDEGGNEEFGNEAGNDLFDCLYDACEVTFPDEFWEEEPETSITKERLIEILISYIDNDAAATDPGYIREVLTDICGCTETELKELGLYGWLGFDQEEE